MVERRECRSSAGLLAYRRSSLYCFSYPPQARPHIAFETWRACQRTSDYRSANERPNAGAHLLPEAGAQQTLEAVRCSALILIEAPSPAYHGGMLRVANPRNEQGGDLNAILHPTAPVLLWYRSPCPHHVPVHPRPSRGNAVAPEHASHPGGAAQGHHALPRSDRPRGRMHVYVVLAG